MNTGCPLSESKSPFHTGPSKCAGEVRYYEGKSSDGYPLKLWACDTHKPSWTFRYAHGDVIPIPGSPEFLVVDEVLDEVLAVRYQGDDRIFVVADLEVFFGEVQAIEAEIANM